MLTVVTTCTPDYGRSWIFPSLGMLLTSRVVCLLHPEDSRPLPRLVERFPYDTPGVLYQDGRFLSAVPGLYDWDLLVLADADGVFQRDFTPAEMAVLGDLDDRGFALGYNLRPGQQGAEEHELLRPRQSIESTARALDLPTSLLRGCWVYNTGFMAGRVSAWKRLPKLVEQTTGGADGAALFHLHSWMQYFLCLTFSRQGLPITELDYDVHSHGHFPLSPKHTIQHRRLYHDGRLVLYAHNVYNVSH